MIRIIQSLKILPRWIILLIDLFVLLCSVTFAYLLRFNFDTREIILNRFLYGTLMFLGCSFLAILITQSYSGIIRYTSIQDGWRIVYTTTIGVVIALLINLLHLKIYGNGMIPLGVIIIAYLNSIIFLFSYRLSVKHIFFYYTNVIDKRLNVVIFGAGQFGQFTKQIINHESGSNIKVVAFLDDDQRRIGKIIDGVKIFNAKTEINEILESLSVNELIISINNLSLERKNEIVDVCLKYNVKVRTVPPTEKWVKGELSVNQIKDVKIEDLLGRESIVLDNKNVSDEIRGKCICVTGAAGSIGSEIVRQLILHKPGMILLVDQAETPLYELNNEISKLRADVKTSLLIADVSNFDRIDRIFSFYKPDMVFHAAAYKHVPMMENNPSEAILCNVLGTKNLADAALKHKIKKFVMISTDKAVNPTSVMGASKRIAEIYVQSLNLYQKKLGLDSTSFITTRFGNVLGSNGSVIPLFKKQIESGGPITITHPEMTRYFMTIPEACQLVLEAGVMGNGCEIFIFDMGKSVKIVDLANKMVQLSGMKIGRDIDIVFSGLRDGEKLYEELLNNTENTVPTHHSKIMIAKVREYTFSEVEENIKQLIELAYTKDDLTLVRLMKYIVPEFKSNYSKFEVLDQKVLNV
ncbi:MAG: polysaccharide biosynthesis protein [Bacteroidota bacterium]|nr:polysaccharide biosynthesis protein [Bacteroidota bacterium]